MRLKFALEVEVPFFSVLTRIMAVMCEKNTTQTLHYTNYILPILNVDKCFTLRIAPSEKLMVMIHN